MIIQGGGLPTSNFIPVIKVFQFTLNLAELKIAEQVIQWEVN